MRRDELRAAQKPLKQRYRDEPTTAQITLQAEGTLDEGIACSVATGTAMARAGLHPATGGDGLSVCSGDILLQALVACAGVTLRAVATSLDITVKGGTVRAEGDLDFRGTLVASFTRPWPARRRSRSRVPSSDLVPLSADGREWRAERGSQSLVWSDAG